MGRSRQFDNLKRGNIISMSNALAQQASGEDVAHAAHKLPVCDKLITRTV